MRELSIKNRFLEVKLPIRIIVIVAIVVIFTTVTSACQRAPRVLDGLCFSPFLNENPMRYRVVSSGRVRELVDKIAPYTSGLRTYASAGEWAEVVKSAQRHGLYVAAGAGICNIRERNEIEVEGLIKNIQSGGVDLAVLGDEILYFSQVSEDELISYIERVKATGVPTTTAEVWDVLLAHPRVMQAVDVVIMNVWPEATGISEGDALEFIDSAYHKVKAKAGGKEVIVETGWPSAGLTNGEAVFSQANAGSFLKEFTSWARVNNVKYFYFEAFDETYKEKVEGTTGPHWGLWDKDGIMKPFARPV